MHGLSICRQTYDQIEHNPLSMTTATDSNTGHPASRSREKQPPSIASRRHQAVFELPRAVSSISYSGVDGFFYGQRRDRREIQLKTDFAIRALISPLTSPLIISSPY